MKIPCKDFARVIRNHLHAEVQKIKKKKKTVTLVTFLVGESSDQLSFVRIKQKVAKQLGIRFIFHHSIEIPTFEQFAHTLKEASADPTVNAVLIQQPLPVQLQTDTIYRYLDEEKEIEGHMPKTTMIPPISQAVLTTLKYCFEDNSNPKKFFLDFKRDFPMIKRILKNKKIVVVGRGKTGGQPIGITLNSLHIPYININSQTSHPEEYLQEADIIITATGKYVLPPTSIKQGVILLNAGLRKENGKLKGDYEEDEIKDKALFYTITPGGIGPLDVLYLFRNVIDAAKAQYDIA